MDWTPQRARVDEATFDARRIGPYRLGRRIRVTALGEVRLAIGDAFDEVVAIERCELLGSLGGSERALLADVAHVIGLRHPNLVEVLGAGVDGDVPYVVRAHRLGVTLADAHEAAEDVDLATAAAILHGVLTVVGFLAEEGAQPGVCSLGGIDEEDVLLGYDGGVRVTNTGMKLVRCPNGDPLRADLSSALVLAQALDPSGALADHFGEDADATQTAHRIRRAFRDACGRRNELVGGLLRRHFDLQIQADRAFFGLVTLH